MSPRTRLNPKTTPTAQSERYKKAKPKPACSAIKLKIVAGYVSTTEVVLASLYDRQGDFGRPYVTGASVPADRVKVLRDAFMKAMNDLELRKEIEGWGLEASPMSGEDLQKQVDDIYATPPEVIKKMHAALGY